MNCLLNAHRLICCIRFFINRWISNLTEQRYYSHGILFLSVAVSTTNRQVSRLPCRLEANIQWLQIHASIARIARYGLVFLRSLTVRGRLLDCWCNWTVMICIWWTADDVAKETQSSVGRLWCERERGWQPEMCRTSILVTLLSLLGFN